MASQYDNIRLAVKGGEILSPRTGRPIVGDEPKNKRLALRVTETTAHKLKTCADVTGKTQTELLEEMVNRLYNEVVDAKK